ncbi:DMT family transporter [Salsuginibacillus kocurii]|uniref:DMT family transporter n=1 Tax=Salsuginibacillus kocurii TaxID=427078 RepID=UPI00035DC9B1|nr:DMT family transporter [Salsuginibacillus kocurii]
MQRSKQWLVYIMLIFVTSLWGSAFVAGAYVTDYLGAVTVAFLRFAVAAVLLIPLMLYINKGIPKLKIKDHLMFMLLGVTGICLYNICFFLATSYAPVVKSSLFIATNPILIMVLSAFFLKEPVGKKQAVGMMLAFSGAFLIITEGQIFSIAALSLQWIDLVLCIAVVTWALYSVLGKVVLQKHSPIVVTAFAVIYGSIFLFPIAMWEQSPATWFEIPGSAWLLLLHMSVLVTVVSFVLYYEGIRQIGAAKAGLFINIMPVSATVLAVVLLGEPFYLAYFLGAVLVISGVLLGTGASLPAKLTRWRKSLAS